MSHAYKTHISFALFSYLLPLLLLFAFLFSGCTGLLRMHKNQLIGSLKGEGIQEEKANLSSGVMNFFHGGKGETIVFIHGFGGDAAQTWRHQLKHFNKSYRVIAPDIYWFGESLPRAPHQIVAPAEQADAIAELIEKQGIEKAHIVGVSFGGYIATRFAMRHPKKTITLSVVDAAGLRPTQEEQDKMKQTFSYAQGDLPKLLIPENTENLKLFLQKVSYKPTEVPGFMLQSVLEEIFWKNKAARTRIALYLTQNFIEPEELKQIQMPKAVFWGDHDPLLLLSLGQRLASYLPKALLFRFDRSAHMPMLEQPEEFNKILASFLSQHRDAAPARIANP